MLLYSFWTGSVRWNLYDIIVYKNQDLLSELIFSRISFKNGEWLAAHHHCRLPIRADSGTGRTTSCDAPDVRPAGQSGILISGSREKKKFNSFFKKWIRCPVFRVAGYIDTSLLIITIIYNSWSEKKNSNF